METNEWTTYRSYMNETGQYLDQARIYHDYLNDLLQKHGDSEIDKFIEFFQQTPKEYILCLPELLYGNLLASITVEERRRGVGKKVIDDVHALETFVRRWEDVKQAVWEMLFAYEPVSGEHFYNFVQLEGYSHVAVTYMFMVAVPKSDQKQMFLQFTNVCLMRQDLVLAYQILQDGYVVCAKDEDIKSIIDQLQVMLNR